MYKHVPCFCVNSPASISQSAKSPMRTSPFTVHFWVSQFGLQLWFINRDEFPFGPASITRSCEERRTLRHRALKKNKKLRFLLWTMFQCHWCYLSEGEHVEVAHVIFMGAFDSLLALLWVYHLPHILCHKVTLEETTNITSLHCFTLTTWFEMTIMAFFSYSTEILTCVSNKTHLRNPDTISASL